MTDKDAQTSRVHYIHRLDYGARERLVGAFVLGAVALLLMLLVYGQEATRLFQDDFELHAYLRNAQGVTRGTQVRVSGVEVGRVESIDITDDNRIHVTMEILERFHNLLRTDSRGELSKLSVIGDATIEIAAGSPEKPLIEDGATIPVEEPLSLDELLAEVQPALDNLNQTVTRINELAQSIDPDHVASIVTDLQATAENLAGATSAIDAGEGTLGRLVHDRALSGDVVDAFASLKRTLDETEARVAQLRPVLDSAEQVGRDAAETSKNLPGTMAEMRRLMENVNGALDSVRYELDQLPELMRETRGVMRRTDETLRAVQYTWPISSSLPEEEREQRVPVRPPDE